MKKKLLAAVLCLAMALTTAACGSSSDSADSSETGSRRNDGRHCFRKLFRWLQYGGSGYGIRFFHSGSGLCI